MTRAYLVQGRVAGFGHQAVVALHPPVDSGEAPPPSQRLCSSADDLRLQGLRRRLEDAWPGPLGNRLGIEPTALPVLWHAGFLPADKKGGAEEKCALCEINVSSVSLLPESAVALLVEATCRALATARRELDA